MSYSSPTADEMARETLLRMGYGTNEIKPVDLARVVDHWLPQTLNAIQRYARRNHLTRLNTLQNTALLITEIGKRRYEWPADYDQYGAMTLFESCVTGTVATGGTSSGVTITTTESLSSGVFGGSFSGYWIMFTGGTALGVMREIVSTSDASPVTTITIESTGWDSDATPAAGDTFIIVNNSGLELEPVRQIATDHRFSVPGVGLPKQFSDHDQVLEFDLAPESKMGVLMRYYVSPTKIEQDSPIMSRILATWRHAIMAGLLKIAAQDADDARFRRFAEDFELAKADLVLSETDDLDFEGFTTFEGFRK